MALRHPLRVVLAASLVLTGCSALIGVNDIFLDDIAGNPDGGNGSETSRVDSPTGGGDGGGDGATCSSPDMMIDKQNCGRCFHDCLGGDCTGGVCQAVQIGAVADAPLYYIEVSSDSVFFSTATTYATDSGGIWRMPKTGGSPEPYVTKQYAEAMAILGDTLYFVVDDYPGDAGTGGGGGLYSCPVIGTAPCAPKLIAAAEAARGISISGGKVYYGDTVCDQCNGNLMEYTPGAAKPVVFRAGYGYAGQYFVDGTAAFYTATITFTPQLAKVIEIQADAGGVSDTYVYSSDSANRGKLRGTSSYLLFAGFDYDNPGGGVVHRITRAGGPAPCDYAGTTNARPYGVVDDGNLVYWTNQGMGGAKPPYTGGSLANCPLKGCCTTATTMWTGDGQPTAVTADDTAVFFVTVDKGAVWKIAKP